MGDTYQEDLAIKELRWMKQLLKEFQDISWYYKAKLTAPVISLEDLPGRHGQWDPVTRTISISRSLMREHPWDTVVEVLKHEMAHMYVCDVFKRPDLSDHGPEFKKACDILGVSEWARRAQGPLGRLRFVDSEETISDETKKLRHISKKAEKLLALANSSNENEAFLAMKKVRELQWKYAIEVSQSPSFDEMESLTITTTRKKIEPYESKILSILNDYFFVRVIHTSLYNKNDHVTYKAFELLGARESVLMAEYVYHFLIKEIHHYWLTHKQLSKCHGRLRRSFKMGVAAGFESKLKAERSVNDVASIMSVSKDDANKLIKHCDAKVEAFVETRYPRLRTKSTSQRRFDLSAYSTGQAVGERISLKKPLTTSTSSLGRYLTT